MNVKLGKRAVSVYFALCIMFLIVIFRLLSITSGEYSSVGSISSTKTIELGFSRGYIYDTNYEPLVNTKINSNAVLLPDNELLKEAAGILNDEEYAAVSAAFDKGQFDIVHTGFDFKSERAYEYRTVERYSADYVCAHIVGYTDNSGKNGLCGIEKAFDSLLDEFSGTLAVGITQSGYQTVLPGCGITVKNDNYLSSGGIVLTIDKNLQTFVENAAEICGIKTGACIVLDVTDNAVLACASFPDYSPDNLKQSLNDPEEPFLNRALSAYPVGSVFKPFIAAAAEEWDVDTDEKYNCTGVITLGEKTFTCYASTSHGEIDISQAIEKSCNCYFIDLGKKIGKKRILDTVTEFGFGKATQLAPGMDAVAGNLPKEEEIDSAQSLANICFGQGKLIATPLQIAASYAAFANGGYYREPYILKQQIDQNAKVTAYYSPNEEKRIISESTAAAISEYLYNNIEQGLGVNARPEASSAAGKTATAQTGIYKDGEEVLDTWFAGFFPYENPEYVIVVFKENGSTASHDCAPMFKAVADYLSLNP